MQAKTNRTLPLWYTLRFFMKPYYKKNKKNKNKKAMNDM